jgi:hypothetical protein
LVTAHAVGACKRLFQALPSSRFARRRLRRPSRPSPGGASRSRSHACEAAFVSARIAETRPLPGEPVIREPHDLLIAAATASICGRLPRHQPAP